MSRRWTSVVLLAAALAVPAGAEAFQAELQRYLRSVEHVCRTGITREMWQAYEEARKAIEAAQYGSGRDNNFWGLRTPENWHQDCFQSPSFE